MIRKILTIILICISIIVFWTFSRFTVDDAFITWRYGKNFVEQGIWNYNPTNQDLTLSYTNPIYALLSIIPHLLNIDVVLFFKLLSILILGFFLYVSKKFLKFDNLTLLSLLAIPPTFIHLFSGLSTFLFGFLMGLLFISYYLKNIKLATLLTTALILTRPEGWLLAGLTPLYFLVVEFQKAPKAGVFKALFSRSFIANALIVTLTMLGMLIFNKLHFGDYLPNTYHVKKDASFSLKYFIFGFIIISPTILVLLQKRVVLFLTLFGFMLFVVFKYSTSTLAMNYCERFMFHLFLPITIFTAYFLSNLNLEKASFALSNRTRKSLNFFPVIYILSFGLFVSFVVLSPKKLVHLANDYPRVYNSYGALGKILSKESSDNNVKAFSIGSIGTAPYNSKIPALDNFGLGSNLLVTKGINHALKVYEPDVVCLMHRYNKEGIRQLSKHANQQKVFEYVLEKNFKEVGHMTYFEGCEIVIFAKQNSELNFDLLQQSSTDQNAEETYDYFLKYNFKKMPWFFWKS